MSGFDCSQAWEPLTDQGIAPVPYSIPADVADRLERRCRQEHLVTASGSPDILALMDRTILEAGGGYISVGATRAVMDDPADPDLGALVRSVVRNILIRDGFHDAASAIGEA